MLISEELEPVWVGACHLHVVWSSRALDIEWPSFPPLRLNSSRSLIEVEHLRASAIRSLDYKVMANQVEVFASTPISHNVEWSFNVQTPVGIQVTLLWFSLPGVKVPDIPLLAQWVASIISDNVSAFDINTTLDLQYLLAEVDNASISISEERPPSWIHGRCSHVSRSSTAHYLDVSVSVIERPDGLCLLVELPPLCLSARMIGPKDNIGTGNFNDSSHW